MEFRNDALWWFSCEWWKISVFRIRYDLFLRFTLTDTIASVLCLENRLENITCRVNFLQENYHIESRKSLACFSSGDPYLDTPIGSQTQQPFTQHGRGERPQWTLFAGAVVTFSNNANSNHGFRSYLNLSHTGDPSAGLSPGAPGLQAGCLCFWFHYAFSSQWSRNKQEDPKKKSNCHIQDGEEEVRNQVCFLWQ